MSFINLLYVLYLLKNIKPSNNFSLNLFNNSSLYDLSYGNLNNSVTISSHYASVNDLK